MSAVSQRYACALLCAVKAPLNAEQIGEILKDFSDTMESSPELKFFLLNPVIPAAAKKDAIKKLLPSKTPVYVENFLCLLIDKRRLKELPSIVREYIHQIALQNGVLLIRVTSAVALTQAETNEISETCRKKHNAQKARVEVVIDKKLLGGIKVQIGDVLTDNSLSGRLRGLKSELLQKQ